MNNLTSNQVSYITKNGASILETKSGFTIALDSPNYGVLYCTREGKTNFLHCGTKSYLKRKLSERVKNFQKWGK